MSDDSFSQKIRHLSKDYYQNHISFDEYRAARRTILDQIDEEFNGREIDQDNTVQYKPEERKEPSIFMKTVAFFANTDLDDKDKSD